MKFSTHHTMKKIFAMGIPGLMIGLLSPAIVRAGSSPWSSNPFDQKVFIQNNGQYGPDANDGNGAVLFSTSQSGIEMHWSAAGLVYRVPEIYVSDEVKREAKREGNPEEMMEKAVLRYHFLEMKWTGADPHVKVLAEEQASFYYTYGDPQDKDGKRGIKADAFKKITYKNLYPGIDAEFILPEKGGVKYSFIVHPGADPSAIQFSYKGTKDVFLNSSGAIEIKSKHCGYFMEHAPVSFDAGGPVPSAFVMKGGTIGFSVPAYDKSKDLVIDPWVSVISFPPSASYAANSRSGYDVCYDNGGNVWVYGGGSPCQLAKYSAGGALLWIFSVPLSSVWLVGDLEVNKNSGTAYVSEGYNGFGAKIVKVNPAGMLTATFGGNTRNLEISRLRLDCTGKLWVTGGGVPTGLWQAGSIDTNLTSMSGSHITTSQNGDHDANLMALDPNGSFMYINFNYPAPGSLDFLHDNEMHKIPIPGYTPSSWVNPGPIHHFTELGSMPYCGNANGMWASRINMFNGMVCGNAYLYTYNGDTLKQWDKSTGTMVKMVKTGGKVYSSGGIDLDLCENVYASVSNMIKVYDSGLNLITTYNLPDTSCYDLKVDKNRNLLYATGNGYACAVSITPLTPPVLNLTATATPANGCSSCNGTATANFTVNSPCATAFNYTYYWMPGGQATSTITGLCPGTYTVIASANLVCSKVLGDTAIVVVNGGPGSLQDDFTFTGTCGAMSFIDTATSGITAWNWSFPGGTPSSSSIQNPTNISYAPGTYTATLIVSAGTGCSDTIVHTFTVGGVPTAAFSSTAPCLGSTTTLSDGSVSSQGDPIQSWVWGMSGGSPTSSTVQNPTVIYTTAGTHSVTLVVTTQSGCRDTIVQQVLVYNPPVAVFTGNGAGCAPVCVSNFTDASTSVDGNITGWTWSFPGGSPSFSSSQVPPAVCYNSPGTYGASLVVTTSYGCKDTMNLTPVVDVYAWPTADFCISPDKAPVTNPVFTFCDLWTPNPGVTNWIWDFGDGTTDSTHTDPVHTYSPTSTQNGFFSYNVCLTVQNQHGCWDTVCKTVELVPEFEFYIPNAFTPNFDFINDEFFGKGRGIKKYDIWLFDRWGNDIWKCHYEGANTDWDNSGQDGMSAACRWDGKVIPGGRDMNGHSRQMVQEDVYVWKVKLVDIFDKEHSYVGHVTVVQ